MQEVLYRRHAKYLSCESFNPPLYYISCELCVRTFLVLIYCDTGDLHLLPCHNRNVFCLWYTLIQPIFCSLNVCVWDLRGCWRALAGAIVLLLFLNNFPVKRFVFFVAMKTRPTHRHHSPLLFLHVPFPLRLLKFFDGAQLLEGLQLATLRLLLLFCELLHLSTPYTVIGITVLQFSRQHRFNILRSMSSKVALGFTSTFQLCVESARAFAISFKLSVRSRYGPFTHRKNAKLIRPRYVVRYFCISYN